MSTAVSTQQITWTTQAEIGRMNKVHKHLETFYDATRTDWKHGYIVLDEDPAAENLSPTVTPIPPEIEMEMRDLGLLIEEIDIPFDEAWEIFVSKIYSGDLAKAVSVCRNKKNSGWNSVRVYVLKQAEAWKIKFGQQ